LRSPGAGAFSCLSIDQSCPNKPHRRTSVCLSVHHERFPERFRRILRDRALLAVSACDETGQSRLVVFPPPLSLRCYAAVSCAPATKVVLALLSPPECIDVCHIARESPECGAFFRVRASSCTGRLRSALGCFLDSPAGRNLTGHLNSSA